MGRHAYPPHRERDVNRTRRLLQAQRGMGIFLILRDEGRRTAQVFLEMHASDLGRRSTLDLDVLLEPI